MALALTVVARDVSSMKRVIADLALSGTYTTGGEAPSLGFLKELGMTEVLKVNVDSGGAAATGKLSQYDYANAKLKLFRTDQIDDFAEEVPNGTALADTLRAEFIGR